MKVIINILSLVFSMQFAFGQSLVITGDMYFTGDPINEISHHLDVKNTANKGITVVCQKTILSSPVNLPTWAGASYCFAGNCYSSSSTAPSSAALLGSGQTFSYANNDLEAFSGYYNPAETPGTTTVVYCFYDQINPNDQTCVTVTYEITSATAIEDQKFIGDFYPNPATNILQFEYYSAEPSVLNLIDVLGNTVKTIDLSINNNHKVDISDLSKGMYFGNIVKNNSIISTKKLIVK